MKSRAFTVIELMASFSIALVIMIVLFNITIIMKDNLQKNDKITNLLVKKDNLSYKINTKFRNSEITSITNCSDALYCYLFTYDDNKTDKLIYNPEEKIISFDNYTFEVTDDITVDNIRIVEHYDDTNSLEFNGYFVINIPILLDEKDYSINILKFINTENIYINI